MEVEGLENVCVRASVASWFGLKDAVLVTAVRCRRFRLGQGGVRLSHSARPARRSEKFEHTLVMLSQHLGQVARHRIGPEEVVIERCIGVDTFRRV